MKYVSLVAVLFAFTVPGFATDKNAAKSVQKPNQWSKIAEKRLPSSTEGLLVSRKCDKDSPTDLSYFVEKKDFAKGAVRVFSVDTYGEPACCSSHLVIYFPVGDEPGDMCFHIASSTDGLGFMGTNLKSIKASYDDKKGLSLKLPVSFYGLQDSDTNDGVGTTKNFEILVNQKTQTVTVKP